MVFPWDTILSPIVSIINKVIPDKAAQAAAEAQLKALALSGQLQEEMTELASITSAQSDINKVEAASPNWYVAGGRPTIIWVCACALAFQYLVRPIAIGIGNISGHPIPVNAIPGLDDNLWQLMFGVLGLGAMRSWEKAKGVAGIH